MVCHFVGEQFMRFIHRTYPFTSFVSFIIRSLSQFIFSLLLKDSLLRWWYFIQIILFYRFQITSIIIATDATTTTTTAAAKTKSQD